MTFTVSCPSCDTSFPIDPGKIPRGGVRAQCSVCPEIFDVDRPDEATPHAPSVFESLADSVEAAESPFDATEMIESDTVDLPLIDGPFAGNDFSFMEDEPVAAEVAPSQGRFVAPEPVAPPPRVEPTETAAPIRFGRRSPEDKAKSLARSLVSDLVAYNPKKHTEALAAGTLKEVFREEIEKSLKEYEQQVEADVVGRSFIFNDALNSILAKGQSIFTVDQ